MRKSGEECGRDLGEAEVRRTKDRKIPGRPNTSVPYAGFGGCPLTPQLGL